jgi:rhodanese-related sulfurtransferase
MELTSMTISLMEMVTEARAKVTEIPAESVGADLQRGDDVLLVDVREPFEFAKGHITGAVNIPRGMLELKADPASPGADPALTTRRDARIVLYCMQSPSARSLLAAETLGRMGYTNVVALAGGLRTWKEQALPVESPD